MELARLRFQQAGLGAEVHAGTPEQLEAVLRFEPASVFKPVVHLPRDFNLGDDRTRGRIRELAARFGGRVYGFVIHDRSEWEHDTAAFVSAASEMDRQLRGLVGSPLLFVEYAVGLEPRAFVRLFRDIQDLETVSACIDVGHVGIRCIRAAYEKSRPGEDICALKSSPPELPRLMPDVEKAVSEALPAVLNLISAVSELGKPVHFHLHDGHPLSKFSPFGVSDHLSFRAEIPLSFEYRGRRAAPTMFGPAGLSQIIARAMGSPAVGQLSFTLEIHPTSQRQGLGDAEHLFRHWSDKTNAEMMNHWLWVLAQNQQLLPTAMNPALAVDPSPQTPPGTAL